MREKGDFKFPTSEFQISNIKFQFSNYVTSICFQLSKSQSLSQILIHTITLTQTQTLTLTLTLALALSPIQPLP